MWGHAPTADVAQVCSRGRNPPCNIPPARRCVVSNRRKRDRLWTWSDVGFATTLHLSARKRHLLDTALIFVPGASWHGRCNEIAIQSERPIGLIGDDIGAVSRAKKQYGDKTIVPVRRDGFRDDLSEELPVNLLSSMALAQKGALCLLPNHLQRTTAAIERRII